jgi:CRISPR/Cas system endoribonuclease Cas6 (RAMP superfamily)
MRFKITLKLESMSIYDVALETAKTINQILGHNNKWHDLVVKPYSCSMIMGGELKDKILYFNNSSAYFYINTDDGEIIERIISNSNISFDIESIKTFKEFNILSLKKVVYNKNGKRIWVTQETKQDFINYVKNKYCVDIDILKIDNSVVRYKNNSRLPISNLLVKTKTDTNVKNLFESGIGGSCGIGFGFVEPLTEK